MTPSTLDTHVEAETCPHLAVFLRDEDELPAVLASFYTLGVRRNGWLAHRALPGDADRERELLTAAGLDVPALEAQGQLAIVELDFGEPFDVYVQTWRQALDEALERGHSGLWYGRFPVGGGGEDDTLLLGFERAWHDGFRDRPVVTICPFIVGELTGGEALLTLGRVAEVHTGVLLPRADGEYDIVRAG